MSETNRILDAAEVEFLLDTSASPGGNVSPAGEPAPAPAQTVTMRGDLEQINLSDIFQTLAMTKMEGVLRVSNPLEQRQIYCSGGSARILVPPRVVKRRLGQLLVTAGILAPESLRKALIEQRKTGQALGEVLVANGHATQEQVAEVLDMQVTEDLFALFTWRHGTFEFYKGPVEDPQQRAAFDACPEYDISSLLLEVARRADEWESILAAISSLDEVPQRLVDALPEEKGIGDIHAAVFAATDARTTYRDQTEHTTFSLFDMARAARDLVDRGCIGNVPDDAMVAAAATQCELGANRKALMLLQSLRERPGDRSIDTLQRVAQVLRSLGESRLAGGVLLEAAQLHPDPEASLALAREARDVSPRDSATVSFLRTILLAHSPADSKELEQCTIELIDALMAEDRANTALEIVVDARATGTASPEILLREARLLQKTRNPVRAAQILFELAQHYSASGDKQKTIEACQSALRLDRSRRDVQKFLLQLQRTRLGTILRLGSLAASLLLLAATGVVFWQQHRHDEALRSADLEITAALESGDRDGARARLEHWRGVLGDDDHIEDLLRRIEFEESAERGRQRKLERARIAEQLEAAAKLIAEGRIIEAFDVYGAAGNDAGSRREVADVVDGRLDRLGHDIVESSRRLAGRMPPGPTQLLSRRDMETHLATLRNDLPAGLSRAFDEVSRLEAEQRWPDLVKQERRRSLLAAVNGARELFALAVTRTRAYETALERNDHQRRLDPVFKAAVAHEKAYEFAEALELYRQLEREPAADSTLRTHFRDQVARHATICRLIEALESATTAGDFASAQQHYRALRLAFPEVPFDRLVRLPLRVDSSPPGATLTCNGVELGRTPASLSYVPAEVSEIALRLDGFEPAVQKVSGDAVGEWHALLVRVPDHAITLDAAIDVAPALDDAGRWFLVDRGGVVTARDDFTGPPLWKYESGDLSGLLSRPFVHGDHVWVASLDGELRALSRRNGQVVHRIGGLPTERSPVLVDQHLVLATTDSRLTAVDLVSRQVTAVSLPRPIASPLVPRGSDVLSVDDAGVVTVHRLPDLRVAWRTTLGRRPDPQLAVADGLVFVRDDHGQCTALELATGQVRWKRSFPHETLAGPFVRGEQILLTAPTGILRAQRLSGGELRSWAQPTKPWLRNTLLVGERLLAPCQDGFVHVLSAETGEALYRLAGHRRSALLFHVEGRTFLTTPDRTLAVYDRLP